MTDALKSCPKCGGPAEIVDKRTKWAVRCCKTPSCELVWSVNMGFIDAIDDDVLAERVSGMIPWDEVRQSAIDRWNALDRGDARIAAALRAAKDRVMETARHEVGREKTALVYAAQCIDGTFSTDAQADFDRRILSAIEPAHVTVAEAARVLLDANMTPVRDEVAKHFDPKHRAGVLEVFREALRALAEDDGEEG